MSKQAKKQKQKPIKMGAKQKAPRRKTKETAQKTPTVTYRVSITKRDDFEIEHAEGWMDLNCTGKRWHKTNKKNTVFTFHSMDDAFKFKLHYERG